MTERKAYAYPAYPSKTEAADLIEMLEAENERLRAENERLQRERDEAIARLEDAHRRLIVIEHEIEEAEQNARVRALEEAAAVVVAWKGKSYMVAFSEIRREMVAAILALREKP